MSDQTHEAWLDSIDFNDIEPIEWCYVNGLPGYACPDHLRHIQRDELSDAGRRGLVFVLGADLFPEGEPA